MINCKTIQYPFDKTDLKMRAEYDASNNIIYLGYAAPGTLTSTAGWQIRTMTYDVSNNATQVNFPSGRNDYDYVWDDRAVYTYS